MMRKKGAADGVLGCAANPGHHGPEEELRKALRDGDEDETNTDTRIAESQQQMTLDESAQATGYELQGAAHGAGDA
jgi:hypothetical protein